MTREEREEVLTEFVGMHGVDTDQFVPWLGESNDDRFYRFPDKASRDLRNQAQRYYLHQCEAAIGMSYDADMACMTQILFANRHATYPEPPNSFGYAFTPNMDALLMTFASHLKHYAVLCAFDTDAMECAAPETLNVLATMIEERTSQPSDVFAFAQDWVRFAVRTHAKLLWTPKPPPPPRDDDSDSSGDMVMQGPRP